MARRGPRDVFAGRWTIGGLVRFHTAHKLILMAHSREAYRELGQIVARARSLPRTEVEARYTKRFTEAVATRATPGSHANVLQHMAGHLKTVLDRASKVELGTAIEEYRLGLVPLTVPLALISRHVRRHDVRYLAGQRYLASLPEN